MIFIADLHVHSRYSRATSRDMTPEGLWRWSQLKGISVIGTGDFTHPKWFAELKEKLEPVDKGSSTLYRLRRPFQDKKSVPQSCRREVFFILSVEISSIYSKNNRTRKVHSIILVPNLNTADKINRKLSSIGNLSSDGRPILGLDAKELLRIVLDISPDAMVIPAHAWTPHFSVFGAASGFDSLEECYDELAPHIHAIETGLSSDPPMNRIISALDGIKLISNSDAHSPSKLGREANIFDTAKSYKNIINAIKSGNGFNGTVEFFPEEGKYHYDGHRKCGVSMRPEESQKRNLLCPVCGKKMTIGVMHRVHSLADRKEPLRENFVSLVPLSEIISETIKKGVSTKSVEKIYFSLLNELGSELKILMDVPIDAIGLAGGEDIAKAVSKVRNGDVTISPGYDGLYGKVGISA